MVCFVDTVLLLGGREKEGWKGRARRVGEREERREGADASFSTIHSFQYNQNHGDYGPTIIVEHEIGSDRFDTLYGHLSRESLNRLEPEMKVKAGDKIAELGTSRVNGDYAPHLHFQVIIDLEGKKGDYAGVCTQQEVSNYSKNCPNPLLLLGI